MALRAAVHRADMAQVSLGLGIATFILAMTIKRIAKDHRERHRVSERARALMGKELPMHIMEHIARQTDPEYICLAIAENKLTVRGRKRSAMYLCAHTACLPPCAKEWW